VKRVLGLASYWLICKSHSFPQIALCRARGVEIILRANGFEMSSADIPLQS
jgi:hypothetical protein